MARHSTQTSTMIRKSRMMSLRSATYAKPNGVYSPHWETSSAAVHDTRSEFGCKCARLLQQKQIKNEKYVVSCIRRPGHRLHIQQLKRSSKTCFYSSAQGSDATSVLSDLVLVGSDTVQKVASTLVLRGVRGDGLLQYCRTSARTKQAETTCYQQGT